MPISAIHVFQLYHGDQFYWWKKPEYPERTMVKQLVNFITCDSFNWKLYTEATGRRNIEFSQESSGIHH